MTEQEPRYPVHDAHNPAEDPIARSAVKYLTGRVSPLVNVAPSRVADQPIEIACSLTTGVNAQHLTGIVHHIRHPPVLQRTLRRECHYIPGPDLRADLRIPAMVHGGMETFLESSALSGSLFLDLSFGSQAPIPKPRSLQTRRFTPSYDQNVDNSQFPRVQQPHYNQRDLFMHMRL